VIHIHLKLSSSSMIPGQLSISSHCH